MSTHKHVFTPLAPEITDSSDPANAETIKWCIRCGTLKIGEWTYTPGKHQKLNLVEDKAKSTKAP